jgi:hypothetical protein
MRSPCAVRLDVILASREALWISSIGLTGFERGEGSGYHRLDVLLSLVLGPARASYPQARVRDRR